MIQFQQFSKTINNKQTSFGDIVETEKFVGFFGNKLLSKEALNELFPEIKFLFLKQVHSNLCVKSDLSVELEADAHFTDQQGLAPVVVTADCMPLIVFNGTIACSIHAGWRGLLDGIITNSLQNFEINGETSVFIGPHIQYLSFEVNKTDVGKLATDYYQHFSKFNIDQSPLTRIHVQPEKIFVNLLKIAKAELVSLGVSASQIYSLPTDTFTNHNYHSARRSSGAPGRNFSFCYLK